MQRSAKRVNKNKILETHSEDSTLVKKNILGVDITDAGKENILEYILKSIKNSSKPYYIVTPNPEMIALASKNSDFKTVLNHAKLALNDGVGVGLAAHIMGISLKKRFTGIQLVEKLCEKGNDWPITVGFLGGGANVAERAAECLKLKYPNLRIVFTGTEWEDRNTVFQENDKGLGIKDKKNIYHSSFIIHHSIDILFVAFGAPKQEFWMADHLGKIPVKVMVGVGGAFDQIVNPSLRPPKLVQSIGLGWFYRLIRQPWRWKRQLALLEFIGMVVKERFKK